MNTLIIVLRSIHIVAGVLWVGSAIYYMLFVEPSVKALGPVGPKFMQQLIEERKYPLYMNTVSILTILAGGALYWFASGGLEWAWVLTGPGLGFTLGSLIGLAVFLVGFFMIRPRAERMGSLGKAIAKAGGPPSAEQAMEMKKLNEEMSSIGRVDAILLTVSLLLMATARYWPF